MRIVNVDAFYVAMPEIAPIADGTQDSFLVRVRTDAGLEGWGEPELTRERARERRALGFDAAKFGWGPMGRGGRDRDIELVAAAREGLGADTLLLVDAGWAWGRDAETARQRAEEFAPFGVGWLEEPLLPEAIEAYARLTHGGSAVPIAAGESSGRVREAEDFLVNGGLDIIQIDAGRIGGITPAHEVRRLAQERGASYVNHTFKSHLSLAAALHVFAAVERFELLECAIGGAPLASELVADRLERRADGTVQVPDRPGLGVTVDGEAVRRYLQAVRITLAGRDLDIGGQEP